MKKLICFGVLAMMFSSCFWGEGEIFLLPENFEGPVMILVGEDQGESIKYEKGKRVYEVPENGILYTQFDNQEKYLHIEYYHVSSSGQRTPIEDIEIQHLSEEEKIHINEPKAYWQNVYGGKGDRSFIIGKPRDLDRHLSKLEDMRKEVFKDGTVITKSRKEE